jgi:hypothetical protein
MPKVLFLIEREEETGVEKIFIFWLGEIEILYSFSIIFYVYVQLKYSTPAGPQVLHREMTRIHTYTDGHHYGHFCSQSLFFHMVLV